MRIHDRLLFEKRNEIKKINKITKLEDIIGFNIPFSYSDVSIVKNMPIIDCGHNSQLFLLFNTGKCSSNLSLSEIPVRFLFDYLNQNKLIKELSIVEISYINSLSLLPSLTIRIELEKSFFYISIERITIEDKKNSEWISDDGNLYLCNCIISYLSTDFNEISFIVNELVAKKQVSDMDIPTVEIIAVGQFGLFIKKVNIEKNAMTDEYLSLHYGEDFVDFNHTLIMEMSEKSKGIVLLHGAPGNGKTYYIRHLVSALKNNGKRLVIVPKQILAEMETPAFNSFMIEEFSSEQNNRAVFIIEDAEAVLRARDNIGDGQAVISTILNLSDGLLNDIYKIQLICTFNSGLENIDKALLREGRLLAKREFCKLNIESSNKLAKHLNIDVEIKEDTSLSDIYSLINSEVIKREVLVESSPKKRKSIGFR